MASIVVVIAEKCCSGPPEKDIEGYVSKISDVFHRQPLTVPFGSNTRERVWAKLRSIVVANCKVSEGAGIP